MNDYSNKTHRHKSVLGTLDWKGADDSLSVNVAFAGSTLSDRTYNWTDIPSNGLGAWVVAFIVSTPH